MKLLYALLSLSASLCIHLAAANSLPCLPAEFSHGYRDFLRHHLAPGAPASSDYLAWTDHLKQTTNCERSLTSFLSPADRDKVEDICTPAAGQQASGNYCMSKQMFTFVSVKSELGTCIVRNVSTVTQHIIVACDLVDNICHPTHLEENWRSHLHLEFGPDCGLMEYMMNHGSELRATAQLCLLLTLLPSALCYFLG